VENGIVYQSLNPKSFGIKLSKVKLVISVLISIVTFKIFNFINSSLDLGLGHFWLGLILSIVALRYQSSILQFESRYGMLKARALVKGDAADLGREVIKGLSQFDFMRANKGKELLKDDANHLTITEETFDIPNEYFVKPFINPKTVKTNTYWCIDDKNHFYIFVTA